MEYFDGSRSQEESRQPGLPTYLVQSIITQQRFYLENSLSLVEDHSLGSEKALKSAEVREDCLKEFVDMLRGNDISVSYELQDEGALELTQDTPLDVLLLILQKFGLDSVKLMIRSEDAEAEGDTEKANELAIEAEGRNQFVNDLIKAFSAHNFEVTKGE